ncbi:beta-ketoacyl [acyl carrier protein] synthase domain-containing protein [Nocardia caishijiensis]|uniref:Mycobactin polyketide synthetase MbtC n=1 Tax=Nocardia caishijiensis TaxID=184756 RepID=A0ABQ6YQW9_9NOCA|nr:polyketide synthase [Nocardia caishijiensis]KAF0848190.1 mycobactin polyketide synthetase MbtC [Nocardia caishijiensis]
MSLDPIVIVGMGIEAPGGIETLPDFWSALATGRELIGPFPRDRDWPLAELFALGRLDGWAPVRDAGGFLDGATEFDATFFGITPREAVAMDPQQRVAMRVAWRALEHAGVNPGALEGDAAGVFMGVSITEYGPRAAGVNEYSGYRGTGTALGAVAGRISHGLGLVGPSISVDTACASSLTAVHQAASAIRAGECDWALAGGVCVMGTPGAFYEFSKNNALATDGHCRSYAADPTGTLWGEGAGVIVLERESRAKALGHRIYGHLLGSRVNHNGAGAPIAVPSAAAQQRLIEATVAAAGVSVDDIDLIEGHGTGTAVGDPLELTALAATYGNPDRAAGPLLGSVKSNAGHAQAASGMLGLIKVLLCGANDTIAPSLWADQPTTDIDWTATTLRLAVEATEWKPRPDGLRYAAVSSFGVAGTNAHAIVGLPVLEETNHG